MFRLVPPALFALYVLAMVASRRAGAAAERA